MNRIELNRNNSPRQTESYPPNFSNGKYIQSYSTCFQELTCDSGNKSVRLTSFEWENGYALYAFKVTDGFTGPGTYGLQFKSVTKCTRLKILFAAAVNKNIKIIIYYQMHGKIEYDKFHAVIVS